MWRSRLSCFFSIRETGLFYLKQFTVQIHKSGIVNDCSLSLSLRTRNEERVAVLTLKSTNLSSKAAKFLLVVTAFNPQHESSLDNFSLTQNKRCPEALRICTSDDKVSVILCTIPTLPEYPLVLQIPAISKGNRCRKHEFKLRKFEEDCPAFSFGRYTIPIKFVHCEQLRQREREISVESSSCLPRYPDLCNCQVDVIIFPLFCFF